MENNVAYIDQEKCVGCQLCVKECPVGVIHVPLPCKILSEITKTQTHIGSGFFYVLDIGGLLAIPVEMRYAEDRRLGRRSRGKGREPWRP